MPTPIEDSEDANQQHMNSDKKDKKAFSEKQSTINLKKIIMENNKNTQRWDGPNVDNDSSAETDYNDEGFNNMIVVEDEIDQDFVQQRMYSKSEIK